ncbi:MAG: serine/threonine protein kinase [Synechococcales cyanobacterium T60_A2020_003]|nr:serine/threonine protein kinase [Synechococcales cyanobacterium T60_A2020_003]
MVNGAEQTPVSQWSYCINPHCQQRLNSRSQEVCQSCGTPLLIAGRYRLLEPLRQLHSGYVTEIFAVDDEKDHTPKVLKVLTRQHKKLIELFKREADVLQRLDSPGIPKVDEIGCFTVTVRDRPHPLYCLVMERIEGEDLQQWLNENGPISQTLALVWLQQLAEILEQIHRNNLFHRDIKPSNIMLRPAGAWGQLALIDFGTAREVTETVVRGQDSTVVYSDGYTAPEQIRGRAVLQSDFFALGRTFIHLLTNRHPNEFPEDSQTQNLIWSDHAPHIAPFLVEFVSRLASDSVRDRPANARKLLMELQMVREELFPRPLFLSSGELVDEVFSSGTTIPLDDDWITQIDDDPQGTYLQASTLAHWRDRTYAKRSRGLKRYWEAFQKLYRRRTGRYILLSILLAGLILTNVIGLFWRQSLSLRRQTLMAQDLAAQAIALQGRNDMQVETSLLLGVETWKQLDKLQLSTLPADQVLQNGLSLLPKAVLQITHTDDGNAAIFSPDGTYVATAGADHTVQLWNVRTQEQIAELTHDGAVQAIAFSPDGSLLATGSTDQTVKVIQVGDAKAVRTLPASASVQTLEFSPNGALLVAASGNSVIVWQTETGRGLRRMPQPGFVTDLTFSANGAALAIAGTDGTVNIYASNNLAAPPRTFTHPSSVNAIAFSPDGSRLLTGSQDRVARLWDSQKGTLVNYFVHDRSVVAVAFSPTGAYLATATGSPLPLHQTHTVFLRDGKTGEIVFQATHSAGITDIAFSADGQRLASASFDHTASVWDVPSGEPIAQMTHDNGVLSVAFSPDGRSLVTSSLDNTAQVWELVGNPVLTTLEHPTTIRQVAFNADGSHVATSGTDKILRLWKTSTGEFLTQFTTPQPLKAMTFSPVDQILATLADRTVQIWNTNTGTPTLAIAHPEPINAIAFHPNGRYLATASSDNTARVWETNSGLEVARLQHDSFVEDVTFSPDGRYVATAALDNTARLWEWQGTSPREVARFAHDSFVSAVAFSPDGYYLATASLDNTVRLWNLEKPGTPEVVQLSHVDDVLDLSFSPDGKYLVTTSTSDQAPAGSAGNVVQVWSIPAGRSVFWYSDPATLATTGFTPDSRFMATVSPTEGVQVWSIPQAEEVARLNPDLAVQDIVLAPAGQMIAAIGDTALSLWTWQGQNLVEQTCDRLTHTLSRDDWRRFLGQTPYRPVCGDR